MGNVVSSVLTHPLTAVAVGIAASLFNNNSDDCPLSINGTSPLPIMPHNWNDLLAAIEEKRRSTRSYHRTAINEIRARVEELRNMENYFTAVPVKQVSMNAEDRISSDEAARLHGVDNVNFFNFAFVGHTNTGKSSLINALRGFRGDEPEAAEVHHMECTQAIRYFTCPGNKFPNVRFYDVPGADTRRHASATYFQDKALCAFDCLIIVIQSTLCREDVSFAEAALTYGQKVMFVRSMCDLDFHKKNTSGQVLIDIPTKEQIAAHITELRAAHYNEICQYESGSELRVIKTFFVSAKSLRALICGEPRDMEFEESDFLTHLFQQSKKARGQSA